MNDATAPRDYSATIARIDARIVELEARLARELDGGFYRAVIDGTQNEIDNARRTVAALRRTQAEQVAPWL